MSARTEYREFMVVGTKHTGMFTAYGTLVPEAAAKLHARAAEIPFRTQAEVALYQPKLRPDHVEGTFYTGYVVTAAPEVLPAGLEFLTVGGTYAVARGDERQMGEIYALLDRWIVEQGYVKESQNALYVEVYDTSGSHEVEVWLPLKPE